MKKRSRKVRHKSRQYTLDDYLNRQNELYFLAAFELVGLFESWAVSYLTSLGLTKGDAEAWAGDVAHEVALILAERLIKKAKPVNSVEGAKKVVKAFALPFARKLVIDAANRVGIVKRYRDENGERKRAIAVNAGFFEEDRDPALTCCCC